MVGRWNTTARTQEELDAAKAIMKMEERDSLSENELQKLRAAAVRGLEIKIGMVSKMLNII